MTREPSEREPPTCPECGAEEPHWNGNKAEPDSLRAEVERLQAALEQIAAALDVHHKSDTEWTDVGEIARAVLEPKPMTDEHASWFWYGRFEGAWGGYVPPDGVLPSLLYWIGNCIGRQLGPPRARP